MSANGIRHFLDLDRHSREASCAAMIEASRAMKAQRKRSAPPPSRSPARRWR